MPWGAAIAGGASLLGGFMSSNASQDAAKEQAQAEEKAIQAQQQMYNQNVARLSPWVNAGSTSLSNLQGLLGSNGMGGALTTPFSAQQYQQSPGYQWQLGQGTQAIMNNASAMGGINSGNTLKALQSYGQGLANQDYYQAQNAYTNWQNQVYGMNAGMSNTGVNAAGQTANLGANTANSIGQNLTGIGNAQAAGTVGSANALGNSLSSLGNIGLMYQMGMMNPSFYGGGT